LIALDNWQTVLIQLFQTPRALKRFMNKVRYLAMQRSEPPERSAFPTITGRLHLTHGKPAEVPEDELPESALVAVAAIDEASDVQGIERLEETKARHVARVMLLVSAIHWTNMRLIATSNSPKALRWDDNQVVRVNLP